jgi:hypothetical protein
VNDNDDDAQFASLADTDPDDIEYMFAQTAEGLSVNWTGGSGCWVDGSSPSG